MTLTATVCSMPMMTALKLQVNLLLAKSAAQTAMVTGSAIQPMPSPMDASEWGDADGMELATTPMRSRTMPVKHLIQTQMELVTTAMPSLVIPMKRLTQTVMESVTTLTPSLKTPTRRLILTVMVLAITPMRFQTMATKRWIPMAMESAITATRTPHNTAMMTAMVIQ